MDTCMRVRVVIPSFLLSVELKDQNLRTSERGEIRCADKMMAHVRNFPTTESSHVGAACRCMDTRVRDIVFMVHLLSDWICEKSHHTALCV